MTRKDFVLIAEAIAQERSATRILDRKHEDDRLDALSILAHNLAGRLRNTNELFDTDRFLKAALG